MTKTPEELTQEWKARKLPQWKFYYIAYSGGVEPLLLNGENDFNNHCRIINSLVKKILAPVPTYDEYKAMQEELTEFKRSVTSYIGKPIDYDIACETVNKLLDDKEQLKKELESARWYQTVQNEDIGKLRGLLRECKEFFEEENPKDFTIMSERMEDLLTRINAALGESEER